MIHISRFVKSWEVIFLDQIRRLRNSTIVPSFRPMVHGKKDTVPKIMGLQWIHSHVRQKNICHNNNNSSSYFVWFYFYFCYNSIFIMKWNKCLVIIFVTCASPMWVKWRTSALATPPILQKVKPPMRQSSLFTAVFLFCFVLFYMFLHDFLSVQNKSIKKNESQTCLN